MVYYPPSDWELIDFYRNHVDAVFRSSCFLACSQDVAERMVREIYMKLLNRGMVFSSEKDARAWMILEAYKMAKRLPKNKEKTVDHTTTVVVEERLEATVENTVAADNSVNVSEENIQTDEYADTQEEKTEHSENEETSIPEVLSDSDESVQQVEGITKEEPEDKPTPLVPAEFSALSMKNRLIALLYYCEGYRKSEIAAYLGCTTFMIRFRLRRIKKRIVKQTGGNEV